MQPVDVSFNKPFNGEWLANKHMLDNLAYKTLVPRFRWDFLEDEWVLG